MIGGFEYLRSAYFPLRPHSLPYLGRHSCKKNSTFINEIVNLKLLFRSVSWHLLQARSGAYLKTMKSIYFNHLMSKCAKRADLYPLEIVGRYSETQLEEDDVLLKEFIPRFIKF